MDGMTTLPLGTAHGVEEDPHLLLQGNKPVKGSRDVVLGFSIDRLKFVAQIWDPIILFML
jgi:hypothetical protein